jgi:hypothetical protein
LQVQVADVCKAQKDLQVELESLRELSLIVVSLKEEIRQLREGFGADHPPSRPSTPKVKSGQQKHGLYVQRFHHFHTHLHKKNVGDLVYHLLSKTSLPFSLMPRVDRVQYCPILE